MLDKVTPKYDLSWYVKWCSSLLVLTGMLLTAVDIYPYNLIFHLFGVMGWCIVGLLWHDPCIDTSEWYRNIYLCTWFT